MPPKRRKVQQGNKTNNEGDNSWESQVEASWDATNEPPIIRNFYIYKTLSTMVRTDDRKVCDFVTDFADQYFKYQQTNNEIPDETLAFMLLSACNLDSDKLQLVIKSLPKVITYIDMQRTLTKISADEILANSGLQMD